MKRIAALCAFYLSTSVFTITQAAEGPAAEEPQMEEVIVTATYRETELMETPVSISAVTDEMVTDTGAQSMEDAMNAALNKLGETYKSQDAINLYNKIRKDNLGEAVPRSSLTRWIGTTRTRCSLTKYVVQQSSSVHHPINLGSHARNWSLTPYNVALEF